MNEMIHLAGISFFALAGVPVHYILKLRAKYLKSAMIKQMSSLLLSVFLLFQCQPNKPSITDGNLFLAIAVFDTTGWLNSQDSTRMTPIPAAKITLDSRDYEKQFQFFTDSMGVAVISGILASEYGIFVEYQISTATVLIAAKSKKIFNTSSEVDTMLTHSIAMSPVVINEIYSCGPPNNVFYFFDQYIELYNQSGEIQYLDGMILTRVRTSVEIEPFIEIWDFVENTYAFQFPGSPGGKEYPIYPGQYVVVAGDAYDHSQSIPGAVNLENADFECVNQLSSDYDNPDVPNLSNINTARTTDYLISLVTDAVILADGTSYWQNGNYIDIPVSTILDGVEYKKTTSTSKRLTRRLDSGYTGLGISNYSGRSRERITPGKDTNNSTVDFEVIDAPTPGYSH